MNEGKKEDQRQDGRPQEIVRAGDPHALSIPMMPIEELKRLTAYVNEVKKALMVEGKDYVREGDRQYTCRSGFAKLAQGFMLSDEPPEITTLYYEEEKTWEFEYKLRRQWVKGEAVTKIKGFSARLRVIQNSTGRFASGEGVCTVQELHLTNNMSPKWYHRCLATAKTRAYNRAVSNFVGSADVSAEEMGLKYEDEGGESGRKIDDTVRWKDDRNNWRCNDIGIEKMDTPIPASIAAGLDAEGIKSDALKMGMFGEEAVLYLPDVNTRVTAYKKFMKTVTNPSRFEYCSGSKSTHWFPVEDE